MKITSGANQFIYETDELLKPDEPLATVIETEMAKTPNNADFWLVPGDNPHFVGCAFLAEDNTYSVCLSGGAFNSGMDYFTWVIRHELRHCEPSVMNPKFRFHDVELFDIGFKKPRQIGFFNEDFKDIVESDELKSLFSNVLHIEKYVNDPVYTKWIQDRKKWIIEKVAKLEAEKENR